jgi:2-oxoglutarate dehydrogenase E1 component
MSNQNSSSAFFATNIVFISELLQKYQQNPASVDASWAEIFNTYAGEISALIADYNGPSWQNRHLQVVNAVDFDISSNSVAAKPVKKEDAKNIANASNQAPANNQELLQLKLQNLISAYQEHGHLSANLDPLALASKQNVPDLQLATHQISEKNLSEKVNFANQNVSLQQVIQHLQASYCQHIGAEFAYIKSAEQKKWLAQHLESLPSKTFTVTEKATILKHIIRTERFEQFLHKRFPGAKRFSIEGGDSAICAIEQMISTSASQKVKKIIIGMAHRGRLNTLTGIMGKPYHQMFAEFQGVPGIPESATKSGDVKYHMGYSSTRHIEGNQIGLSLAFNPSHLEAVNPVVAGRVRAKQDLLQDSSRTQALSLLIHGDAAFAGQGSVAENLVMNGLNGYNTGGVVHLIINNQIGFTANPQDSRSTLYASDLAKSIDAPIFHINADSPEDVCKIAHLAILYRQQFQKDIVIDLICYRRYGHNEGDEPMYTQPVMYSKIKDHPTLEKLYSQKLIAEKSITDQEYQSLTSEFDKHLAEEFELAKTYTPSKADWLEGKWQHIKHDCLQLPKTAVNANKLQELISKITDVPADFNINSKIAKQLETRLQVVKQGAEIDWGTAEALAFATLLDEGFAVRITGQDSGRGTFSHRHSVLHDAKTAKRHNVFSSVGGATAKCEVHDSVLSEYAVLGFEYGYSLATPNRLTIWEAQFGDFANGAQIIFDQFIASSEVKWLRKSNLVMLLPHGFEGQGPEHSSARLERYLQACANNNLKVVNITNPANFFHVLRGQLHSADRKPLVVMSPKSLLRHKLAVSNLGEFTNQNFSAVLPEASNLDTKKVKRVVLCSGKVYYDLFEAREANKINDIAIIRLEQLYPFLEQELAVELKKYPQAQIVWCQEEPKNMGAWLYITEPLEKTLANIKHITLRPQYVGRVACASPATGYGSYHSKEQKALINEALNLPLI